MNILPQFILATTTLFLIAVVIHGLGLFRYCAVCITVSLSWMFLLVTKLVGYNVNPVLTGVLMGESIIGLYYLLERKAPVSWQIFRWPYIITMTVLTYVILGIISGIWSAILMLVIIWIVCGVIFAWRESVLFKKIAEQLIACCRDW